MKRILALDIGDKRIGIANSDLLQMTAQPLYTLTRKNTKSAIEEICGIILKDNIETLVVGLPRNMDGTEGFQAQAARKFAESIRSYLKDEIEIVFWDERLTSKIAKQSLSHIKMAKIKQMKLVDTVAAVHILQSYLDNKKIKSGGQNE